MYSKTDSSCLKYWYFLYIGELSCYKNIGDKKLLNVGSCFFTTFTERNRKGRISLLYQTLRNVKQGFVGHTITWIIFIYVLLWKIPKEWYRFRLTINLEVNGICIYRMFSNVISPEIVDINFSSFASTSTMFILKQQCTLWESFNKMLTFKV